MPGLYTEADYENSVIELFRNDMRKFCLTLCTA